MSGYARKALMTVAVIGIVVVLAGVASAGGKGGGKPKPPPEPTPGLSYSLVALPLPEGVHDSYACGMNDHGQVVGYLPYTRRLDAVVWRDPSELPINLGQDLPESSYPEAINNDGQIVGYYQCWEGDLHTERAAVWVPDAQGGYERVDLPSGNLSEARDINDKGWIGGHAGTVVDGSIRDGGGFVIVPTTDAAGKSLWFLDEDDDGVNDLECRVDVSPAVPYTIVQSLNDDGWVAVACYDGGPYLAGTVVIIPDFTLANPWWKDEDQDGSNDLAVFLSAEPYGSRLAINNSGQVVAGDALFQVSVAQDGSVNVVQTTLPPPARDCAWTAYLDINDAGLAVGSVRRMKGDTGPDPYLWLPDEGTVSLEGLVSDMAPFTDLLTHDADDFRINAVGQIMGHGSFKEAGTMRGQAFLATPVSN